MPLYLDKIVLREYRPGDLEGMFRLDERCFAVEFRFDRRAMRWFVERRGAVSVVADGEDGEIAGFVIVQVERVAAGRRGYVVTLDVAVEWRRRGLAAKLMAEVERRAWTAGAGWMELEVFAGNAGAIFFYERMGYSRVGERCGFYGEGLDGLVYRKGLVA